MAAVRRLWSRCAPLPPPGEPCRRRPGLRLHPGTRHLVPAGACVLHRALRLAQGRACSHLPQSDSGMDGTATSKRDHGRRSAEDPATRSRRQARGVTRPCGPGRGDPSNQDGGQGTHHESHRGELCGQRPARATRPRDRARRPTSKSAGRGVPALLQRSQSTSRDSPASAREAAPGGRAQKAHRGKTPARRATPRLRKSGVIASIARGWGM
jgi:hypothetical protein